jgi:hypothetical protein
LSNIGFVLPDLILEHILREGFQVLRQNPQHVDVIMSFMKQDWVLKKYGQTEINKIKKVFSEKEFSIVHAFSDVVANAPCISIQLSSDVEMTNRSGYSDIKGKVVEGVGENQYSGLDPITEESLVLVDLLVPSSYNPVTGIMILGSGDMSSIQSGHIYRDASGNPHTIQGVDENTFSLFFLKNSDIDISNYGKIVSALNTRTFQTYTTREKQSLLLGMHSKNRLMALYLYTIVKYILHAKKRDLIKRGFDLPTMAGSDFTRDLDHMADIVHHRFLTVSGEVCENWVDIFGAQEQAEIFEATVLVDQDVADNEDLELTESTIQVVDNNE